VTEANEAQREAWNGEGGQHWVADADGRDRVLEPVGEALLAAAQLRPGEDVLDVGCGCGAVTLAAAALVAPGTVTGADLSATMLAVARERAGATPGVTLLEADVQTDAFEPRFDVVLSRFGTMFFDDQVAAFTTIRGAVRPDGRLCLATWQPLEANDWLTVPGAALLERSPLPALDADDGPGMFGQSRPERVRSELAAAGWRDVAIEPVTLSLRLGTDAPRAAEYLTHTGMARRVLDSIPEAERPAAIATVTDALAAHESDAGVHLDAGIFLITARP
jgi:SAM-dependent methyltransferase